MVSAATTQSSNFQKEYHRFPLPCDERSGTDAVFFFPRRIFSKKLSFKFENGKKGVIVSGKRKHNKKTIGKRKQA